MSPTTAARDKKSLTPNIVLVALKIAIIANSNSEFRARPEDALSAARSPPKCRHKKPLISNSPVKADENNGRLPILVLLSREKRDNGIMIIDFSAFGDDRSVLQYNEYEN